MKPKVRRLIEQELLRRASIMVEARRIALAENLLIEKNSKSAIKQQIRDLIQQAEDAGDEGDEKTNGELLKRAEELAKENGLNLTDIKAKVEPSKSEPQEPKPDDEEPEEPEPGDEDEEPEPGGVADKKPESDDDDEDESGGVADKTDSFVGSHDDDDDSAPPMPKDGKADDSIRNGDVTYEIAGKKFGEVQHKAIPTQWFKMWLEREKFGPAELKLKLTSAQQTSRELTPPRTNDREKLENFKERQTGYTNKINAIQTVLRSLQKVHNKDIDTYNKRQERRRDRINTLVDTLSDGNPLMKVIVGLLADKLMKNKEKVNYTDDDDPYGDD